jgi:6-phosphogluconolactonase
MTFLYTGAYTVGDDGRAEGIGVHHFNPETGVIDDFQYAGNIANPSFLALGPDGDTLYSVAESPGPGQAVAYARDPELGTLAELNRQSTEGRGPCHISLDHSGRYVLVANYGSGQIAALPILEDGSLGPATGAVQQEGSSVRADRQEGPHAHMIAPTPDGRYVYATDLGADRVFCYTLDDSGALVPVPDGGATAIPGSGPRHFAFSPDGGTVYVLNELGFTLDRFAYDAATGALDRLQQVPTLPDGFNEYNLCAHVVVSPDGRFVYASNRGHDSIATWSVGDDGALTFVDWIPSGGRTPRNFSLDLSGNWLVVANMGSDDVVAYRRDLDSGLTSGDPVVTKLASVCCLVFAGK